MSTGNVITGAFYASPYATLPPGVTRAGITANADITQIPPSISNPIFVIKLCLANDGTVVGVSATSGPGTDKSYAVYQPAFPLSSGDAYMIYGLWVSQGQDPNSINWDEALGNSPVTGATLVISEATFDGTNVNAIITSNSGSIGSGTKIVLYALAGSQVQVGSQILEGNIASFAMTQTGYPAIYSLGVQPAIPVVNQGGAGSFQAPFSFGQQTPLVGIPQMAQTVTSAIYDGQTIMLSWNLNNLVGCADPESSTIEVMANGNIIATGTGGTTSARIAADILNQSAITVNIRTVASNITAAGLSSPLITQTPLVTNVVADTQNQKVTASVSTVSNASGANAYLMNGTKILAGPIAASGGTVSFDYNALDQVGLSVVAEGTSGILTGPKSSDVFLLATAPQLLSATVKTYASDSTKWQVDVEWDRLPDDPANVSSYSVNILEVTTSVGNQSTSALNYQFLIAKSAIDITKTHSIQLGATGKSGGAASTASYQIIFSPPLLSSATVTSDQVLAGWTAPSIIPLTNTDSVNYQMIIADNSGNPLYSGGITSGMSGAVSLAELALVGVSSPQIMINVYVGKTLFVTDNSMGAKSYASLIVDAPVVNAITANPTDNISVLTWGTIAQATTYTLHFSDGTQVSGISGTSHSLGTALSVGQQLAFNVQAVGASNGVALTGPGSTSISIPSNETNVTNIRFNGSEVELIWDAQPEALNYSVTVYDNETTPIQIYSGNTSEIQSTFTVTGLDSSKEYTAYVQAINAQGTGLSGNSLSLFSEGLYLSQQAATDAYPYIYPGVSMEMLGTSSENPTATILELYLPELCTTSLGLGQTAITSGPFSIATTGNTQYPYLLTIAADDEVWKFDTSEIRTTLQTDYVTFLTDLETPPGGGEGVTGASPYGISLVQAAIGRYMPQTYAEMLYYNFGFSTVTSSGAAYVDLRPGTVLRATISDYQEISGNSVQSWIKGYAGSAVFDLEIGGYTAGNNWRTGFDGFLSALSANGALTVPAPYKGTTGTSQSGVAGAVDLYYPSFVQPFYRMFVPSTVTSPSDPGNNSTTANFTLAATSTYASLQTAGVNPASNATAYFRSRTTLEVMIRITVNGTEQLVPIGTTVGNILDQQAQRPYGNTNSLNALRVYRSMGSVVTNTSAAQSLPAMVEVRFDWNGFTTYANGNGLDAVSMPLLAGDQVFTE